MKNYILGSIRKIIFESNSGPYKVGLFKIKETNDEDALEYVNKVIGFTGNFAEINEDVDYILYGKLIIHPKYGLQYSVDSYEISVPSDTDSLIMYLSSGMFKGIGTKTAKKIVERFGSDTVDVIKDNYEELALISGMNMKKARMIHDKMIENDVNQDLIIKLNGYGFSVKEAIDLSTMYGLDLINIIEENIYELVDYVSFDKLDLIFLKDHDEMSSVRIKALIKHNIKTMCYESGDTLIHKEELFIRMKRCFKKSFSSNMYVAYINELLSENELVEVEDNITLYEFYEAEKYILSDINRISNIKDAVNSKKIDEYIKLYEKRNNIEFNKEQRNAIEESIKNNFYIITGGPGTGKTTIIKAIVELLESISNINKNDIALLAPTGRSAKRMSESVGAPAYTIHKFLKWNKETETFGVDEYNKASEKVIIVDEASMVDIFLFSSLLKGLRINVKLLLIGDANQLPSIGPGDVLNDLLHMNNIKSKCLNIIYRVKDGSYITYLANDIKNKKVFDTISNEYADFKFIESNDDNILSYLKDICKKIKNKNISIENFQVLAPMYKGLNGIDNLNELMAEIFNGEEEKYQVGDKYYRIGDKVIQLVNDVENNVFNGDIGYIKDIDFVEKKMEITISYMGHKVKYKSGEFDRFTLAYAISVHKSQGSEYDNVVVVLAKSFKRMFYNKLIYTAVTRAKQSLIIIGSLESFNSSVQTLYADNRNTYLKRV
ncbi:MAG: ATP-dependent RecD-like DNA helicase [Bacilli bacterium]|nr:ATP-dependent RecD-like DNA helicase [Bacilli bacterium]